MLYRKIESLIEEHLKSDSKKILLIDGARQIGKTYIINHVGEKIFENYIEINMIINNLENKMKIIEILCEGGLTIVRDVCIMNI